MANCKTKIEIHEQPGKTQNSRTPVGLKADFVLLDERKIQHLIVSTVELSKHIHFYGTENTVEGNWSSFFAWESTSLFAELSTLNVLTLQRELKIKTRQLLFINDEIEKNAEMLGFFQNIDNKLSHYFKILIKLPNDIHNKEYYMSFWSRINDLSAHVSNQIELTANTQQLFYDHLFNKAVRNLFGMLMELKTKSTQSFKIQIESYPKHSPQYALFITFLRLFSEAQKEANQFTKRHLDFYYKKVLNLKPISSQPDYVHCTVEPHKNQHPFLLNEGNVLLADKTENGKQKFYATTSDLTVNQAKINQVFGGFLNTQTSPNTYYFRDFTEVFSSKEVWKPFSSHTESINLGFALASPLLFLKSGKRTITITFQNDWTDAKYQELKDNFNFYLTSEEEWIEVTEQITIDEGIKIDLLADVKPIVPFDSEIHDGVPIVTDFPVLKITSKNGKTFKQRITSTSLAINVNNYKGFSLYSDNGEIDFSKKFEAFGAIPRKDASLYFSSNEFFQKKGATGTFEVEMDNSTWTFLNNIELDILINSKWINQGASNPVVSNGTIQEKNFTYDENPVYDKNSVEGIVRLKLNAEDFSSTTGNQPYLDAYMEAAKAESIKPLPYLPIITEFKFNYNANSDENTIETFHLYPKGHLSTNLNGSHIPQINNEGELFVGISNVIAGQPMNLLIQMQEGTANPTLESVEIGWQYLNNNNQWMPLTENNFGDETNGLTQSGIVYFKVPENFETTTQTILPKNMFWLKIAVPERTAAVCNFIGLHLQAFKAVLFDYEETGIQFVKHLEPNSISKLLRPRKQIKKISQPYISFGGKTKDNDFEFYKRTSERLRHRARAISKWDYETLILDKFPHVYRVKCLPHFKVKDDGINNSSAGNVTLVPVAASSNNSLPVSWRPLVDLGTMKRIKDYLLSIASPHVTIDVIPPNLEQVLFSFHVKYHESTTSDFRLYSENLNEIINAYLSPWAYETKENVQFQNEIQTSKLIQIIESQSYVDYLWDFKAKHYDDSLSGAEKLTKSFKSTDNIVPLTEYSLFLPGAHDIKSETDCCK